MKTTLQNGLGLPADAATTVVYSPSRWLWVLLVVATVCIASANTVEAPFMPPTLIPKDKAAHLVVFGLIATLIYRALPQYSSTGKASGANGDKASGANDNNTAGSNGDSIPRANGIRAILAASANLRCLLAIGITAAFGIGDEIHQSFNPARTFDWYDFAADASGAIIAVCAYRWLHCYRRVLEWRLLPRRHRTHI